MEENELKPEYDLKSLRVRRMGTGRLQFSSPSLDKEESDRMTITLMPELEEACRERAQRQGVTPEYLIIEELNRIFLQTEALKPGKSITERLNEVYSKHSNSLDPLFVEMRARSINPNEG